MTRISPLFLTFCALGAAFVAPSFCFAADAQTEEADIPQIVITPTRIPSEINRLPVDVSVVTRQDIETQGIVSLQDAVESLPGVSFVHSPNLGGIASMFMRGAESSHTLVLLDGMPINDPSDPEGSFNFGEDLLGSVDHIEAVQGPSSVLYGSQAIGGVINLVSRAPVTAGQTQQLDIAGGSAGTGQGEGLVSGTLGKTSYLMNVQGQHTDGYDTIPSRFGSTNDLGLKDGSDTYSLFSKLGYALDDNTKLQGQIRWRDLSYKLEQNPSADPSYFGTSTALNWQLRGTHDWLNKKAETTLSLSENLSHRTYTDNPNADNQNSSLNFLRAHYMGARYMVDGQNDFRLPSARFVNDVHYTQGVTYQFEAANINYISNGSYGPYNQAARAAQGQTGIFQQIQGRALDRVDVTAGMREDMPDLYPDHFTYKTGAVLQLPEVAGRIKSSFGTSYRTPSLYERYGVDSYGLVGNANLRSETAESWDAGFEKDMKIDGNRHFATLGATYFETTTRNMIEYEDSSTPTDYQNIARAETNGVETQLKLSPTSWVEAHLNWTCMNAINASGQTAASVPNGEPLMRRPHNVANADVTTWITPEWDVTPKIRYTGTATDTLYDNGGNWTGYGHVGGTTVVDFSSNYRYTDQASVYGRIVNLLNRTIESPNGYRQEGFSFLIGFRYKQ